MDIITQRVIRCNVQKSLYVTVDMILGIRLIASEVAVIKENWLPL
jgi:hypothetical protein